MLVNKRRNVVDLVVDDHVEVLLGGVGGDLLEGEFFFGHGGGVVNWRAEIEGVLLAGIFLVGDVGDGGGGVRERIFVDQARSGQIGFLRSGG